MSYRTHRPVPASGPSARRLFALVAAALLLAGCQDDVTAPEPTLAVSISTLGPVLLDEVEREDGVVLVRCEAVLRAVLTSTGGEAQVAWQGARFSWIPASTGEVVAETVFDAAETAEYWGYGPLRTGEPRLASYFYFGLGEFRIEMEFDWADADAGQAGTTEHALLCETSTTP